VARRTAESHVYCPRDQQRLHRRDFWTSCPVSSAATRRVREPLRAWITNFGPPHTGPGRHRGRVRRRWNRFRGNQTPTRSKLRLQADCYAECGPKHANPRPQTKRTAKPLFTSINPEDITDALAAAGGRSETTRYREMVGPWTNSHVSPNAVRRPTEVVPKQKQNRRLREGGYPRAATLSAGRHPDHSILSTRPGRNGRS